MGTFFFIGHNLMFCGATSGTLQFSEWIKGNFNILVGSSHPKVEQFGIAFEELTTGHCKFKFERICMHRVKSAENGWQKMTMYFAYIKN